MDDFEAALVVKFGDVVSLKEGDKQDEQDEQDEQYQYEEQEQDTQEGG